MQKLRHVLPHLHGGESLRFYQLGDIHIGNVGFSEGILKRHVRQIADDPHAYVFLMGDILDAVSITDKRYAPCAMSQKAAQTQRNDIINVQAEQAIDLLRPLKGKVLGCLIGNHEEKVVQIASADPLRIVADALEFPYEAAYCGYFITAIPWSSGSKVTSLGFMLSHGAGGGALSGAKINRVERRGTWWHTADVVASGHNHKRSITSNVSLGINHSDAKMTVRENVQLCLNTGSYLRGYADSVAGSLYTERADFPPCELGGTYVQVDFMKNGGDRRYELKGGMI